MTPGDEVQRSRPPPPLTTPEGISLYRLIDYPCGRVPDRIAVRDGRASLTFADVRLQSNRLHSALLEIGAGPQDRIAVILPNCVEFVVAEAAILRGGMVKVPLNIRFHVNEVIYALRDSEPTVLICDETYAGLIIARRAEVPSLKAVIVVGGPVRGALSFATLVGTPCEPTAAHPHGRDDIALIRYTGGTTGRPKGVVHTAGSLIAIAYDQIRELHLVESDVVLHLGHLSHGLNFSWPAYFAVGATQVLHEAFDTQRVLHDLQQFGVTCVYMVPTMIHRLLAEDSGGVNVSTLRMFMYSSAPMPVPLLERAIARFGDIFLQVYTLSEAPVISTMMLPAEHLQLETEHGPRLGSCGREIVSMELKLLDESGAEVAPGETGEIAIRSVNNMAGYWRLPQETARTLIDGWVMTGDMGRRDRDGFLYLVDRKKDIIITGAFNVYPKEVEDVLYMHPDVAQCAVVGVPSEEWGETIVAFVVRREGAKVEAEELTGLCRANLAGYKKPRAFHFVDSLPLTPVGKILRRALRDIAQEAQADLAGPARGVAK